MAEQITPHLLPVEINLEKRRHEILKNTIKMLTNRKLLNSDKLEENIKTITETVNDDMLYKIQLDNPDVYNLDSKTFHIKLLKHKITSITKTSLIGDYLNNNKNPTIIIVDSITQKIYDYIRASYKNTEVFTEKELMMDIISHISVPPHELLDEKETAKVLDEYMVKKKEMPKILLNDPITKYFNGQIGQSFRIIRPSETSGLAVYHRLIVRGNIKN
jgi:DNA-directed RNA polymerase subunit H (RpoH/RPB5)